MKKQGLQTDDLIVVERWATVKPAKWRVMGRRERDHEWGLISMGDTYSDARTRAETEMRIRAREGAVYFPVPHKIVSTVTEFWCERLGEWRS